LQHLGSTTFNLPDLRGMFLRGVNGSRNDVFADPNNTDRTNISGTKVGNVVGSLQDDAFQNITGSFDIGRGDAGSRLWNGSSSGAFSLTYTNITKFPAAFDNSDTKGTGVINFNASTSPSARTSTETRPSNAYVNYIIKY